MTASLKFSFAWRRVESRRGFTLIELLTVIAIIGILAAIIIPTVGKVRQTARSAQCASNVRQVSMALLSYAQDNKNFLPKGASGSQQDGIMQLRPWNMMILPYIANTMADDTDTVLAQRRSQDVLKCPAFISDRNPSEEKLNEGYFGIGLNLAIGVVDNPASALGPRNAEYNRINLTRFSTPSRLILVGDTTDGTSGGKRYQVVLSSYNDPNNTRNNGGLQHGNRANYGFADGHVKSLTPEEATALMRPNS